MTQIHAPPSLRGGQAFTATVTVCNRGTAPATNYYYWPQLELYLSMDASLSMPGPGTPPPLDQRMIGSVQVAPLDPGQCSTQTVQATAWLPQDAQSDGAFYLGAIVDVFQVLHEADETNNAHVAGLVGVGHRSDLVVTELSAPASVRPGDAFTARVRVCNQGTESTSGFSQPSVELYLSLDDSLTAPGSTPGTPPPTDQRMIGNVSLPPLAAGQCVTREVNATASLPPDAQGDGSLYLGAIVDAFQSEQELREDNNAHVGGKLGVGHRADLVVTEVTGPASVQHGDAFTATVTVCNQGTETSSSFGQPSVELYLSLDDSLVLPQSSPGTPPPTDQRPVGFASLPSLAAGQCATRTVNASALLPYAAQGDGAYYLGAIVDPMQSEFELREDNNTHVAGLMGVGYSSDLVVTEVRGPSSVRHGDAFTASVTVCNQGTAHTSGWNGPQVELYLSTDTTLTPPQQSGPGGPPPTDQRLIGTVSLPGLNAGQCATRDVNATAYAPQDAMSDGALYLGAIVDPYQYDLELREDNNIRVGGLMGVGSRSDLVVTRLTGPASVRQGDPFTATVRVCNQGTESTSGWNGPQVELYLSMDTALSPPPMSGPGMPQPPTDQRLVGNVSLPMLQAGQCVDRTVNATAYTPQDAMGDGALYLGAIVDAFQSEQELREDNNAFIGGLMGVGHRADLVVTELSGPASVHDGDDFTATVKVCNQGTEIAGGSPGGLQVELYLSMDTTLTPPAATGPGMPQPTDQRAIGYVNLQSLPAGQCVTRAVNAHAFLPQDAQGQGAYYLGAIVDPLRSEQELREDNNAFIGGLMGVGHRSDLVVTEVSAPASVHDGDPFTATVKVCNQGTESTSGWSNASVELYLSMDTTLTPPQQSGPSTPQDDQRLIGSHPVPSLFAGQCVSLAVTAYGQRPPAAMPEGALYLGAIVDPHEQEQELREDNNIHVGGLIGVGHRADLVVTQLSAPANLRHGDPFTATVKVCNQGTVATSSWSHAQLELYLSMDTALTLPTGMGPSPTDQRMIGTLPLPELGAGQCVTRDVNATAQAPQDAMGDVVLHLGAIVDPHGQEQELREDNNTFIGGKLGVGFRADLVVTQLSGPVSAGHGAPFMATVKVCNQGTEPTFSSWSSVELYLSTGTTLTAPTPGPGQPSMDQQLIGHVDLPWLGVGQCVTRQVHASANLPQASSGDGAYYLGAIVDAHQSVQELQEDNNTFIGGRMGVGNRPDLVVTEVKGPASVRPGDSFTVTAKVCNQGTTETGYNNTPQLELYLSTDDALSFPVNGGPSPTDQLPVAFDSLPVLQPGECSTRTLTAYASLPQAAMWNSALFLGAIVDVYGSVQELREDNNVLVGGRMGVGTLPDLVVTEVNAPTSVRPGDAFTATVKVCNQGTEDSGVFSPAPAHLELYQSVSPSVVVPVQGMPYPQDGQQLIGGTNVGPLSAGQCVTLSVPASAGTPPGSHNVTAFYLAAVVDTLQVEQELREDNNTFVAGLMGVGHAADLVITELTGPASVQRGQPFTASVKVCNQGTEPSNAFNNARLEVYLSTTGKVTMPPSGPGSPLPPGSEAMVGYVDVQPLAVGQCETVAVPASGNAPPDATTDGALFLGAIIDAGQYVNELREDNNVTVGGLIGVGSLPDLVITELSAPASVRDGDPFTATVKVCNQGTTLSGTPYGTMLGLFISTDTSLSSLAPGSMPVDQVMVNTVQVDPLVPGQCTTISMQGWAYLPPVAHGAGNYYLGAYVDPYVDGAELRADNNARADHVFEVTW